MRLVDLLTKAGMAPVAIPVVMEVEVSGVVSDSRLASPGDVFVAISGTRDDGGAYVTAALARGAVAVVSEKAAPAVSFPVPWLQVPDARLALARLASAIHGDPARSMRVFAVTGTNGKTTTAGLLRDCLSAAGLRTGLLSTVEYAYGDHVEEASRTTPDTCTLQRLLGEMRDDGCAAVSMEASSHALDQHRVGAIPFAGTAFTNLSRDHFDYHHDFESYYLAKRKLFEQQGALRPGAPGVVNADDPYGRRLLSELPPLGVKAVSYAIDAPADIRAENVRLDATGSRFTLVTPFGSAEIISGLLGRYNVSNLLCVAGLALYGAGLDLPTVATALSAARPRWGRLEKVVECHGAAVFVDYAHTPDAIEKALTALREITRRKLTIVFGCGGDRDRAKRPQMAAAAARIADSTVLTSDNPRTEDSEAILDEAATGFPADYPHLRLSDRHEAIRVALAMAEPGDVVLIAGKGHETYQEIDGVKHPFDDREVVRDVARTPLFTAEKLARWSGGSWSGPLAGLVTGFSFDSRQVREGDLFVALRSETADGHAFVEKALAAGAAGALVRTDWKPPASCVSAPFLRVEDPYAAMHAMAAAYRREVAPYVVGVTGSVGKSTVKEWTAALLAEGYPTASTLANFNNGIGLPISLLSMAPDSTHGVFEVGMNHKGELAPLCETLAPDAGIVTSIGPVHLEHLGTMEAIAEEKATLFRSLPAEGFAVVDRASPWFDKLAASTKARLVTVGVAVGEADYIATVSSLLDGSFVLSGRQVETPVAMRTGLPGEHNVLNALYAIAAARSCGVPWDRIVRRIGNLPHMKMRWEHLERHGVHWINDAYNANPVAMAAALKTFARTVKGRRVYVLGEMRELGPDSRRFHEECGSLLGDLGGDLLVGVGEAGGWMADAAVAAGFRGEVILADDAVAAGRLLREKLREGDSVLLKASRGVALERVIGE